MDNTYDRYRRNAPLSDYTAQATQQLPSYAPSRREAQWQYQPAVPYSYDPPRMSKWRIFLCHTFPGFMIGVTVAVVAMFGITHTMHHPATVATVQTSDNTLVCQHYKTQRAWVKGLAKPTLTDAVKFATWVAADAAESTGTLHTNLAAMSADEQHNKSSYAASEKVVASCQALGVQF